MGILMYTTFNENKMVYMMGLKTAVLVTFDRKSGSLSSPFIENYEEGREKI